MFLRRKAIKIFYCNFMISNDFQTSIFKKLPRNIRLTSLPYKSMKKRFLP